MHVTTAVCSFRCFQTLHWTLSRTLRRISNSHDLGSSRQNSTCCVCAPPWGFGGDTPFRRSAPRAQCCSIRRIHRIWFREHNCQQGALGDGVACGLHDSPEWQWRGLCRAQLIRKARSVGVLCSRRLSQPPVAILVIDGPVEAGDEAGGFFLFSGPAVHCGVGCSLWCGSFCFSSQANIWAKANGLPPAHNPFLGRFARIFRCSACLLQVPIPLREKARACPETTFKEDVLRAFSGLGLGCSYPTLPDIARKKRLRQRTPFQAGSAQTFACLDPIVQGQASIPRPRAGRVHPEALFCGARFGAEISETRALEKVVYAVLGFRVPSGGSGLGFEGAGSASRIRVPGSRAGPGTRSRVEACMSWLRVSELGLAHFVRGVWGEGGTACIREAWRRHCASDSNWCCVLFRQGEGERARGQSCARVSVGGWLQWPCVG